jgi:hypothetical protein
MKTTIENIKMNLVTQKKQNYKEMILNIVIPVISANSNKLSLAKHCSYTRIPSSWSHPKLATTSAQVLNFQ